MSGLRNIVLNFFKKMDNVEKSNAFNKIQVERIKFQTQKKKGVYFIFPVCELEGAQYVHTL